jgi:hypothetical protein
MVNLREIDIIETAEESFLEIDMVEIESSLMIDKLETGNSLEMRKLGIEISIENRKGGKESFSEMDIKIGGKMAHRFKVMAGVT